MSSTFQPDRIEMELRKGQSLSFQVFQPELETMYLKPISNSPFHLKFAIPSYTSQVQKPFNRNLLIRWLKKNHPKGAWLHYLKSLAKIMAVRQANHIAWSSPIPNRFPVVEA